MLLLGVVFTVHGRRYRLLEIIGQGGEATVYRCEDQAAAQYAVKVFDFSRYPASNLRRYVNNFKKEARILKYMSQRSHHFVHLFDYEYKPMENVGYMIMELGEASLRQHLVGAPLNGLTRRALWKQIVTILADLQDAHVGKDSQSHSHR
jgi:serine/threonine protein kinase